MHGGLLFRCGGNRLRGASTGLLAGPSITTGESEGSLDVKEGFAPFAGRRPIAARGSAFGATAGIDLNLAFASRLSLTLPVRFTWNQIDPSAYRPDRFAAFVGAGVRIGVAQTFLK